MPHPVRRDQLEAGPIRVAHEYGSHRRIERAHGCTEDRFEHRLERRGSGDRLDRRGEGRAGVAGLSIVRHEALLHAVWWSEAASYTQHERDPAWRRIRGLAVDHGRSWP